MPTTNLHSRGSNFIDDHKIIYNMQGGFLMGVGKHFGFTLNLLHSTQRNGSPQREVIPRKQTKVMWCHKQRECNCCGLSWAEGKFVSAPSRLCLSFPNTFSELDAIDKLLTTFCGKVQPGKSVFLCATLPVIIWKVLNSWFVQDPKKEED